MWKKSVNDKFSLTVYIVCTILALTRKVPLALIIIGALVCGITWQKFEDRQKLKNEKAEGKE